ncbi:hypothetical protein [Thermococcus sp.]|uniref:hypothetical protein n=1 Tax=Thermococcus sp. TaxID=35749 RepID=UPI002626983F|nr:hypothetical protein [Thermococcus sp.]
MYSASLAQASSQGIIFSVFIVALAWGVYFLLSQDARALGASVLMFILAFVARDYYHLVYAAGGMLGFAVLMSITDYDEGTFRGALYFAGLGTFISLGMYYLLPLQVPNSPSQYDLNFAVFVVLPAAAIILLEGARSGFEYDGESFIAMIAAFVIAFGLIQLFGVTHLIWGIALMLFGIIMKKLTGGFVAVTGFVAGFIIWLDDVIAYYIFHDNQIALHYLGPLGAVLVLIFLYMEVSG